MTSPTRLLDLSQRLYGINDVTATPHYWSDQLREGWTLTVRYWPSRRGWRVLWRDPYGKIAGLLAPGFVWKLRDNADHYQHMVEKLYG